MNKNEICEQLILVCNTLNNTTVTGIQNAANISACYSIVQEVIQKILSCEVIPPEGKPNNEAEKE